MNHQPSLLDEVRHQYARAKAKEAKQVAKVAALRRDDPARQLENRLLTVMRENTEGAHVALDLAVEVVALDHAVIKSGTSIEPAQHAVTEFESTTKGSRLKAN